MNQFTNLFPESRWDKIPCSWACTAPHRWPLWPGWLRLTSPSGTSERTVHLWCQLSGAVNRMHPYQLSWFTMVSSHQYLHVHAMYWENVEKLICFELVDVHTQCNTCTCTNLFRAEFMCSIHEMSTNNWKHYAKSVLGWELHALLKLVLKYLVVEATIQKT